MKLLIVGVFLLLAGLLALVVASTNDMTKACLDTNCMRTK